MKKTLFLFIILIIVNKAFSQDFLYMVAINEADRYGIPIICDSLEKSLGPINIIDTNIEGRFDGYISIECKLKNDTIHIDSINIKYIVDREPRTIEYCYDSIGNSQLSLRAMIFQDILRKKLKNAFFVFPSKRKKKEYIISMTINYNFRFRINCPFEEDF